MISNLTLSVYDKIQALITLLQQHRFLLVLDGFERELHAYAGPSAAYRGDSVVEDAQGDFRACTQPQVESFLRWVASSPLQGRVLLTSRLFPRELDGLAGCRCEELTGLDPKDAVRFFQSQEIRRTRAEIQAICAPSGYHPLTLSLLAGMITHKLISVLARRKKRILDQAYYSLRPSLRKLLSRLAAFRSPVEFEAIQAICGEAGVKTASGIVFKRLLGHGRALQTSTDLRANLTELVERNLLIFDRERDRYDLHPIVRQHAYSRLTGKADVHTRLRDYLAAHPAPEKGNTQSPKDLEPVIELYYHTVHAGRYDEAYNLFDDRLFIPLYWRFGDYQTCIELLRLLFSHGNNSSTGSEQVGLPLLKNEQAQTATLNVLGHSYSRSGQPRRALLFRQLHIDICRKQGNKRSLALGLGSLAEEQIALGKLAEAERNLEKRIEISCEIKDAFLEAVGHYNLGLLLAYMGSFGEAQNRLEKAQLVFDKASEMPFVYLNMHSMQMGYFASAIQVHSALCALLMKDTKTALASAHRAQQLANKGHWERALVRAEWLLGATLVTMASQERSQQNQTLAEAETHLTEALTLCRCINMVDHEPDILLAWARWYHAKGNVPQAYRCAQEALAIADRCEYRLKQADIHNFLAHLPPGIEDRMTPDQHAQTAHECAECDGEPHWYKPAMEEAKWLLLQLNNR